MRRKEKASGNITPVNGNTRKSVLKPSDPGLPADRKLRKKAEDLLNVQRVSLESMSDIDVRNLVHELQVHQIELEMQNEELRRTQVELEESRAGYSSLYDFAPVGYFTFDRSGHILNLNLTASELLRRERSYVKGRPFSLFIHKNDSDMFYRHCQEVLRSEERCSCEVRLNSGEITPLYIRLDSIRARDENGEYSQIRTAAGDITERKMAEEVLELSNHILEIANRQMGVSDMLREFVKEIRTFTGCAAVGVRILDKEGHIPYQAYEGFSDEFYEKESPLSIKFDRCMCINVVKRETDPKQVYFTEGGSFYTNSTTTLLSSTAEKERGRTRNICNHFGYETVVLVPIRMGEEVLGLIHVADPQKNMVMLKMVETLEKVALQLGITIRRIHAEAELGRHREHLEELVEERTGELRHTYKLLNEEVTAKLNFQAEAIRTAQLASLGELSAGVAHEINNPVNGIINYAQMILNKAGPEHQIREITKKIIKEGDRIAGIVTNLLSFARAGKENKQGVHVKEIMSDSLSLMETYLKSDGIRIEISISKTLPLIMVQPNHIEQVFLNVLSNARYALNLKYPGSDKNKVIEIACDEEITGEGSYVIIRFIDHGLGISEDIIDKIMNPFFTTKPAGDGAGLGLSISHGIIAEHHGEITIESIAGEHTSVVIKLPAMKRKKLTGYT